MSAVTEDELHKLPRAPYPGLRPFEKDEWPIFFGRETMAHDVIARLIEKSLVAIHGDSGCGKSSLVRAGVLPVLELDQARVGGTWKTVVMRPEESPIRNLVSALADGDAEKSIALRRAVNRGESAARLIAEIMGCSPRQNVCILLDQFEELFEYARKKGRIEAEVIVGFLSGLARDRPKGLHAVLTMRSDYFGQCAHYRGFAEVVNQTQYLVPPMERPELRRAIQKPAALYGGKVEPALVDRLIADSGAGQDQLPLIQHGLMLMWRNKTAGGASGGSWILNLPDYDSKGGLRKLLSAHADQVLATAATAAEDLRIAEATLRALTDNNADKQAIRRPQEFADLCAVAGATPERLQHVLLPFRAAEASFLRPYGEAPLAPDSRVDISHEAFIRNWDRMADPETGWLAKEADDGLRWTALRLSAKAYSTNDENLLSPAAAEEAHQLFERVNPAWAERYNGEWEGVQKLASASRKAARRATNRWRLLVGAAVIVAVTMAGLSLFAWQQTEMARAETARAEAALKEAAASAEAAAVSAKDAEDAKARAEAALIVAEMAKADAEAYADQAEREAARALYSETVTLGALARIELNEGRPIDALKLALAAWPRNNDPLRPTLKDIIEIAGRAAASSVRLEVVSRVTDITVAQLSPDSKIVAVGATDGSVKLWSNSRKQWSQSLTAHTAEIISLDFSADSKRLVTLSKDGKVVLWSLANNSEEMSAFVFPDGHDYTNVSTRLNESGEAVTIFDPASSSVYVSSILNWSKPLIIDLSIPLYFSFVGDVSPDGKLLAIVDVYYIYIIDSRTGELLRKAGAFFGGENSDVEFSFDGLKIIVTSSRGIIRIFDTNRLDVLQELRDIGSFSSASLSPDNNKMLTCGNRIAIVDLHFRRNLSYQGLPGQTCELVNWATDGGSILALFDTLVLWDVSAIGSLEAVAKGCVALGNDTNLADIEKRYGLTPLPSICGDNPPLPVDPANLR